MSHRALRISIFKSLAAEAYRVGGTAHYVDQRTKCHAVSEESVSNVYVLNSPEGGQGLTSFLQDLALNIRRSKRGVADGGPEGIKVAIGPPSEVGGEDVGGSVAEGHNFALFVVQNET